MAIENRLRQRLDLQQTRRQQLQFKEAKRQAEREEEEEFRRKVLAESIFNRFIFQPNFAVVNMWYDHSISEMLGKLGRETRSDFI